MCLPSNPAFQCWHAPHTLGLIPLGSMADWVLHCCCLQARWMRMAL
jgi:hypothetical protein